MKTRFGMGEEREREIVVVASVRLHDSWGKRLIYFRHDLLILYLLFPLALYFRPVKKKQQHQQQYRFASAWEKYIKRNKCKWVLWMCINACAVMSSSKHFIFWFSVKPTVSHGRMLIIKKSGKYFIGDDRN